MTVQGQELTIPQVCRRRTILTFRESKQRWMIIAEFFRGQDDRWLDDFITDDSISLEKLPLLGSRRDWHSGASNVTPMAAWFSFLGHTLTAFRSKPVGVIACFPQLAICAAFWKRIGWIKPNIIAYNFNLGELRPGLRQHMVRAVSNQIDCYIVHSPKEVVSYAEYLRVPQSRVKFVPLQRGEIDVRREEETEAPFIVAMGSAHRDYWTLVQAVDRLALHTIIVTRASDIVRLPESPHVTYMSGMTEQECIELMARARICVTPIANMATASGQVTFINAMQVGVPVIATRSPGTEGYIEDGCNGILVEPFDVEDLASKIDLLWQDEYLRARLSNAAQTIAIERFSDQAAADKLIGIIRALT